VTLTEEDTPEAECLQCWVIGREEDLAQSLAELGVDLQQQQTFGKSKSC
jgi:hypothetical protein